MGVALCSTQLSRQVPSLISRKYCYVGIHVRLGTLCEVVSPNFHALNGSDCMDGLRVTWDSCRPALSMQGQDIMIEHINGKCHVFTFSMQEEDILKRTNGKCHLCTR